MPVLLVSAELTVDHITVAGKDLKALQANLAAQGIPSVYGGPRGNHSTEMAVTSFPEGAYLELIASTPTPTPELWRRMPGPSRCRKTRVPAPGRRQ